MCVRVCVFDGGARLLVDNWLRELHLWCPKLTVLLYYGSQEERAMMRAEVIDGHKQFNVLVTTYVSPRLPPASVPPTASRCSSSEHTRLQ